MIPAARVSSLRYTLKKVCDHQHRTVRGCARYRMYWENKPRKRVGPLQTGNPPPFLRLQRWGDAGQGTCAAAGYCPSIHRSESKKELHAFHQYRFSDQLASTSWHVGGQVVDAKPASDRPRTPEITREKNVTRRKEKIPGLIHPIIWVTKKGNDRGPKWIIKGR